MVNLLRGRRWLTPRPALLTFVAALCLALSLVSIGAPGQAPTGTFSGTVRDLSGAGVRATITVTHAGAHIQRTARSNASGVFTFPQLPPGRYDLEAWAPGFVVFQLHAVTVYANQDVMFNIALSPHAPGATNVPQEVEVSGEIAVLVEDDFENGRSSPIYELTLNGAGGQEAATLEVSFAGEGDPKGFATGDRVRLRGFRYGNRLSDAHITGVDSRRSPLDTVTSDLVSGNHTALVMTLRTTASAPMCTNETLNDVVFTAPNSVSAYYTENSYSKMSVSGTVVGPYTVAASTGCNLKKWSSDARREAQAAGVVLSNYQHLIYVLPPESIDRCTFGGRAELPGNESWIVSRPIWCSTTHVISHEVGHNLGAYHANTPGVEYGDHSSTMGSDSNYRNLHFNAPSKDSLGWLPGVVQTVTASGSHRIALLQEDSTNIKALKIAVPGSATDSYYLSYRRAVGLFDWNMDLAYADKTSVHRWSGSGPTILLANLASGESFNENGITVTQTANDSTYAYVTVAIDAPPPQDTTPPTAPSNLTAKRKGSNVDLSWTASIDNSGVTGYDVYRNNAKIATTGSAAYSDSTTTNGGGTYTYHVVAFDAAGNVSTASNITTIVR